MQLFIRLKQLIPLLLLLHQAEGAYKYNSKRKELLQDEKDMFVGANIKLTMKENQLNECLMRHKLNELDYAFENPHHYNFTQHFFRYKTDMHNSKVYKIIKDLPKGAALHLHDVGILGPDYLMNFTYLNHIYGCFDNDKLSLKFSEDYPTDYCNEVWVPLGEARTMSNDAKKYDAELKKHFTMVSSHPNRVYPSIDESYTAIKNYFKTVSSMLFFRPVWEKYFYDVLKAFREDNVLYIEFRGVLPQLYEIDGTIHDRIYTVQTYEKIIKKFVKDYPDFIGAKFIFAPIRDVSAEVMKQYLKTAHQIKEAAPAIFAGFDLVGPENRGKHLNDFVPDLTLAANNLTYFFHAGETNMYGCPGDENLVDAILLGAKRIGHGYALAKHPLLLKEVMQRDIAIEVNVISNNVLSLVQDMRNHPLALFLGQGMPVVLSSDVPGAWEAEPLSDDFYVAFMGVASRWADLRLLKQLALNSLKYSALNNGEKTVAFQKFNSAWDNFVQNFNCSKY